MEALRSSGLDDIALEVIERGTPFFGICIGMQLLCAGSEESPGCDGLGVFDQTVVRIPEGVKHPQMQWNVLDRREPVHPMFTGQPDEAWMYFVHSFAVEDGPNVVATCDYGAPLVAAVARDDLWAVQFHPEKSGENGLRMLESFVTLAADRAGVAV